MNKQIGCENTPSSTMMNSYMRWSFICAARQMPQSVVINHPTRSLLPGPPLPLPSAQTSKITEATLWCDVRFILFLLPTKTQEPLNKRSKTNPRKHKHLLPSNTNLCKHLTPPPRTPPHTHTQYKHNHKPTFTNTHACTHTHKHTRARALTHTEPHTLM